MTINITTDRKLIEDYLSFAEDEHKAGTMTEEFLSKIRLQMAAEYLLDHDDEELCMVTLNKVPEGYFKNFLAKDMEGDSLFAAQCAELAYHLELRGITFDGIIRPTQNPGQA